MRRNKAPENGIIAFINFFVSIVHMFETYKRKDGNILEIHMFETYKRMRTYTINSGEPLGNFL